MKTILYILLIFSLTESFAQQILSGKYCYSYNSGYSGVCIDFKGSNKFTYEATGDLGLENIGKGDYFLKGRKLILIFAKDSIISQSNLHIEKLESHDRNDSINFIFQLLDKENANEPLAGVILKSSGIDLHTKTLQTDSSGYLKLTRPRYQESENYLLVFNGYERFEFTLADDHSKKITIALAPLSPNIISGQIFTLNLSKRKPNFFITKFGEKYQKSETSMAIRK